MSKTTLKSIAQQLQQQQVCSKQSLTLKFGECVIGVRSNSDELLDVLNNYYKHWLYSASDVDLNIIAIESAALDLAVPLSDWKREPGKRGRKDAYYDFDHARLVHKVRTGMLFLQSATNKIAAGPCLENSNQIINYINSQHMNWLQQRQWQICHAAGVVYQNQAYAVAGFSGGGKSTFMLHLVAQAEINYLTNDRLFIKQENGQCLAAGVGKLPRINPGTIVHNSKLHGLLSGRQRTEFLNLPKQQLWDLEDKYDVDIEAIYGVNRIEEMAPLKALIILNWQHQSELACSVNQIDLNDRRDLLAAVMKSPGPFYQKLDGVFINDQQGFDEAAYIASLSNVAVYEVSGKVDFVTLQNYFNQHIVC